MALLGPEPDDRKAELDQQATKICTDEIESEVGSAVTFFKRKLLRYEKLLRQELITSKYFS